MLFSGYYNAKLLLTGEYLVLQGADALAVPLRFGQSIEVSTAEGDSIEWYSLLADGTPWFMATFLAHDFNARETSSPDIAEKLSTILREARAMNPLFCQGGEGCRVITRMNYPPEWGLGSSSTLLAAIARWAKVDPFNLHFRVSGGSGYDIACALSTTALVYNRNRNYPVVSPVSFKPAFSDKLFFVYQGRKQDSLQGIKDFNAVSDSLVSRAVDEASGLTKRMLEADTLEEFESVMADHEKLISGITGKVPIKQTLFSDLQGEVKSLGAWGGDFCLITWKGDYAGLKNYLESKGLEIFFSFDEIILNAATREL